MKKIITCILTLVLLLANVPVAALAYDPNADNDHSQAIVLVLDGGAAMNAEDRTALIDTAKALARGIMLADTEAAVGVEWYLGGYTGLLATSNPTEDMETVLGAIDRYAAALDSGYHDDLYQAVNGANDQLSLIESDTDMAGTTLSAESMVFVTSGNVTGINETGRNPIEINGHNYLGEARDVFNRLQEIDPDGLYDIYTVGVTDGLTGTEKANAVQFLNDLQTDGYYDYTEIDGLVERLGGMKPGADNRFIFGEDNYSFGNYGDFIGGHASAIQLQDELFLMDGLSPSVRATMEYKLTHDGRGGHCYGMASSAILNKIGAVDMTAFTGTDTLYDAERSNRLDSMLCYYQLMQFMPAAQQSVIDFRDQSTEAQLNEIVEEVGKVAIGGTPVLLAFGQYGNADKGTRSMAHAVVAYAVDTDLDEPEYSTVSGKTYTGCVYLYDSNRADHDNEEGAFDPNCNLYFNLDKNEWEIPGYGLVSDDDDVYLKQCANTLHELDPKTYNSDEAQTLLDIRNQEAFDLIREDPLTNPNTVWGIDGGRVTGPEPLVTYHASDVADDGEDAPLTVVLPEGDADYTLSSSYSRTAMDVSLQRADSFQAVTTAMAKTATLDDSGDIAVTEAVGAFELTTAQDNLEGAAFDTYTIVGNADGAEDYKVAATDTGAAITGTDLHNVLITGSDADREKAIAIDTDATTVQAVEEKGELTVKADVDGDGTCETTIAVSDDAKRPGGYDIGDIDGSLSINAADALQALRHSVKEIKLTGTAFTRGNVAGKEEQIDASDALDILRYSVKEINGFERG